MLAVTKLPSTQQDLLAGYIFKFTGWRIFNGDEINFHEVTSLPSEVSLWLMETFGRCLMH